MFYNKKIVKNINEVNMVDVLEQVTKRTNRWFSRKLRGNDLSDIYASKKIYDEQIDKLNKCYFINKKDYVEAVLKQVNGEVAYQNNQLSNLTCTYANLCLPVIDSETNAVFIEEHPAIFYTGHETNKLMRARMYSVEDAKKVYEYVLKQIYQNKMVLLKENKSEIDISPLRKIDTFSFSQISYNRYPTYHLVGGSRQDPQVLFGVMDVFANQFVCKNLENMNINIELVEQKPILKNVSKIFTKFKKQNCHPSLKDDENEKHYKVKVKGVGLNNTKSSYLKEVKSDDGPVK